MRLGSHLTQDGQGAAIAPNASVRGVVSNALTSGFSANREPLCHRKGDLVR